MTDCLPSPSRYFPRNLGPWLQALQWGSALFARFGVVQVFVVFPVAFWRGNVGAELDT